MSDIQDNTIEINLPSGNTVKIKKSIKAKEYLFLKNYIVSKAQLKTEQTGYTKNGSPTTSISPTFNGEDIAKLEEETIKVYLISFNRSEDRPYEKMIETISGAEYETVKEAVDNANSQEEKK